MMVPFSLPRIILAGAVLLSPLAQAESGLDYLSKKSNLSQEPGSIAVEDLLKEPIKLRVLQQAPIYYQLDFRRQLGTMARGTEVTVIGLSEQGHYRVRGKAFHGGVSGWMRVQDLAGADPQFATNLRKLYERQNNVMALIEKKEIALGMTTEEVVASIGRPSRTSKKMDATGRSDIYEYITYDRVPQHRTQFDQYGRAYTGITYVKVETGKLTVSFNGEVASSIEETEGNPLGNGGVITVPPPIVFR